MQKKYALAINGVRGMVEARAETHQSSERTVLLVLKQTEQHKDICGPLLTQIMLRMHAEKLQKNVPLGPTFTTES